MTHFPQGLRVNQLRGGLLLGAFAKLRKATTLDFETSPVFWMLYAFFWVIPRRLNSICLRFGTHCLFHPVILHTYLPMKMEQTECSETSAYKIQTPGNYPEESIQQATVSLVMSVCVSVRIEQLDSHRADFYEVWCLSISRKYVEKTHVSLKSDEDNSLHEDIHVCLWYFAEIPRRMRFVTPNLYE